jgi:GAF domain-containing protein
MIDRHAPTTPSFADPDPPPAETLAALTRDLFVATADDLAARRCAFAELLRNVREILGMDIAFVSEFVGDKRVFHHVSLSPRSTAQLSDGDADVRGDSYCQRVVDGRLPGVIGDTAALCAAADLSITRTLSIGAFMSEPVVLGDGTVYGTVCCISHSPRTTLGNRQIDALRCVATFVAREIERQRRL